MDLTLEGGLDFNSHKIPGVVEATVAVLASAGRPGLSNNRDQRVTGADAIRQNFNPINTKIDAVDIEKYTFRSQSLRQTISNYARWIRRVLPPIADEYATRLLSSGGVDYIDASDALTRRWKSIPIQLRYLLRQIRV